MNWEKLNIVEFQNAVATSKGVCLLPMGCLEKHGDHLPLGTDLLCARDVAFRAADIEPAVVFPSYPFGQVSEVRHFPGTIAVDARLQMEVLQALCDEIARSGLRKIILVNGHGGSTMMARFFAQSQLDRRRDYAVYVFEHWMTAEQAQKVYDTHGKPDGGGHADLNETSLVMAQDPALVRMENVKVEESRPLGRLNHLRGVYTGIGWYADYPHQFAGSPVGATPERGAMMRDFYVANLVESIRSVKLDNTAAELQGEFFKRCE